LLQASVNADFTGSPSASSSWNLRVKSMAASSPISSLMPIEKSMVGWSSRATTAECQALMIREVEVALLGTNDTAAPACSPGAISPARPFTSPWYTRALSGSMHVYAADPPNWREGLALTLALVACSAPPPSPSPPGPAPPLEEPSPRRELVVVPGSSDWRAVAGTSKSPLRWAVLRARRSPAMMVGDGVLFVAPDGGFALADAGTGALRWRGEPAPGVRWEALAATADTVLAFGLDAQAGRLRTIDLASGAGVDRHSSAKIRRVLAVGPALAFGDRCDLELVGPGDVAPIRARGRIDAVSPEIEVCGASALLVAADATSAVMVRWIEGTPRIDRVDRRDGAVMATIAVEARADVALEPITGLVLVTWPDGKVRALRVDAAGPVDRTWTATARGPLALRGVRLAEGAPLLLVGDDRRWAAVDPVTLKDRWSIARDTRGEATVVLLGEVTPSRDAGLALARAGELQWLDPRDGASIARHRLPPARSVTLLGELAVIEGHTATFALDVRSGAPRWATPATVKNLAPDGTLAMRVAGTAKTLDIVDTRAASRRLRVEFEATLLARLPRDGGDLSLLLADEVTLLAAFADDATSVSELEADPIAVVASPCGPRNQSIKEIESYRACHTDRIGSVAFERHSAEIPGEAFEQIDRLARRWRTDALAMLDQPENWPQIHIVGHALGTESPTLAGHRAAAIRDALIARSVPCSAIAAAAGSSDLGTSHADLVWVGAYACIL